VVNEKHITHVVVNDHHFSDNKYDRAQETYQGNNRFINNNGDDLNDNMSTFEAHKPLYMETAPEMNKICERAAKSAELMGEFSPILESNDPTLPIYGPYKDTNNGSTYKGQFFQGKKEGLGQEIYENGSFYEGHYENGIRQGQGRFVSFNGDLFQGEFQNNKAHGVGTLYTYDSQTTYTGNFFNDKPHGKGKEEYSDGTFYLGDFREGRMTGKCKFIFKDGGVYKGDVVEGMACGKGQYTYKNPNKTYVGDYERNLKHGYGVLTLEKYKYIGQFKNGKMDGPGQFEWEDGRKLIGDFDRGVVNGEVKHVNKEGFVRMALYNRGKFDRYL